MPNKSICLCCLCAHARLSSGQGGYDDVTVMASLRKALAHKNVSMERFMQSEMFVAESLPFMETVLEVPWSLTQHFEEEENPK